MIHFFPSLPNLGGFSGGLGALYGIGDWFVTYEGVLNGAGPVLIAGFLCVCMSAVTFFSPEIGTTKVGTLNRRSQIGNAGALARNTMRNCRFRQIPKIGYNNTVNNTGFFWHDTNLS